MRRRWVKLLGASIALGVAVLLAASITPALDADLWWLATLAAFGMWPALAVSVALMWSAARQYVGPHPTLITMPDRLDPAERDAWAELERRLGDGR